MFLSNSSIHLFVHDLELFMLSCYVSLFIVCCKLSLLFCCHSLLQILNVFHQIFHWLKDTLIVMKIKQKSFLLLLFSTIKIILIEFWCLYLSMVTAKYAKKIAILLDWIGRKLKCIANLSLYFWILLSSYYISFLIHSYFIDFLITLL